MGGMDKHSNITLIGMPGAGKSTLGVVLAKRAGLRFVDTDLLIQEGSGRLLSELIAEHGTEGFKAYENEVLSGLVCEHHVIATGGSAIYGAEAMRHLASISTIVFIDITFNEMQRRLGTDLTARGVVMPQGMTIHDVYEERRPLYQRYADVTVKTSGMSTRRAVELVASALDLG